MLKIFGLFCVAFALMAFAKPAPAGCRSTAPLATSFITATEPATTPGFAQQAADTGIVGTPAPGSLFSKIQPGMDKAQVQSIIGPPTDQSSHNTPKVYIPFYSGPDTTEIEAHYKGEGILTYASRQVGDTSYVLKTITVNPSEPGFIQ